MNNHIIENAVEKILNSLPKGVLLVAAAKTRTLDEINTALKAGIKILGYNYIQEAEKIYPLIKNQIKWHMIGHLQSNKVNKAVEIFDMIETVDSVKIATKLDKRCGVMNKKLSVLIEINSGKESNKTGVLPEDVDSLIQQINHLQNIRIEGLMTMGPRFGNPEDARPYFKATREAFERIKRADIENVEMKFLSMGMSNSYKIALEEGANIVRIGTRLFGERMN